MATVLVGLGNPTSASAQGGSGEARNVILLIGDGMGDSEITIARNYHLGAAGTLAMDTLPNTGAYTTYSVQEDDPETPDYVPDSAPTATAWSTGQKTSNGRISTTPGTDEDIPTILELAQEAGKRTGNVTTSEVTDATPAALMSHVSKRGCKGPEETAEDCPEDSKAQGGPGSIAEQGVDHGVDVILGGARGNFEQTIDGGPDDGSTVIESAERQGYEVVETAGDMQAVGPGQPLLGLFADENMDLLYSGEPAETQHDFSAQTCEEDQLPEEQPDLASMTTKALELLDNPEGFFLQVESASIDKQDHVSNPCEQIGETVNLDNAVRVALDYAEQNPDTLVVVTGDHGHTSQIVPTQGVSGYHKEGYEYSLPSEAATVNTADGSQMTISYATNTFRDENGEELDEEDTHTHTGTQIRVAGQGPLSEQVLGVTDQTDLFATMAQAMGLEASPTSAGKAKDKVKASSDAAQDEEDETAYRTPKTASDNTSLLFVGAGLFGGFGFALGRKLGKYFFRRRSPW
jgi:alkaline phosphatase